MELLSFLEHRKTSMVSQAKKGDKDAFLSLIDENRLSIYRVARGILNYTHLLKSLLSKF